MKILPLFAGLVLATFVSVANAGLAIIAHPSNPTTGITSDEAARVYTGKIRTLSSGAQVMPVDQAQGSPARAKFYRSVVKMNDRESKSYWSRLLFTGKGQPPKEIEGDEAVRDYVSKNPDAIGYVDGKFLDQSVKVLLIVP
jgi:ABC-type phosphate transport system substrate-binding protein